MKGSLRVALLAIMVPASAFAETEPQFDGTPALRLLLCSKVADNATRLKCFDDALIALQKPTKASEPETDAERGWDVQESKSPVDDSPQVMATLFAQNAAGALMFRCRERKIDGMYMPDRFVNTRDNVRGLYRLNSEKPVEVRWNGSTRGTSAFFNNATAFLRSLPDDGKLFMRAYDFQGASHDATFNLNRVSEVRTRIFAACAAAANSDKAKKQ